MRVIEAFPRSNSAAFNGLSQRIEHNILKIGITGIFKGMIIVSRIYSQDIRIGLMVVRNFRITEPSCEINLVYVADLSHYKL